MKFLAFILGLFASVALAAALGREEPAEMFTALLPEVTLPPEDIIPVLDPNAPLPVAFQPQESKLIEVDGATQAWQDWMSRHNLQAGAMALGYGGEILSSNSMKRSADAAYPVAGLSKAITAMCLNVVLAENGLTWNTTLRDLSPALAKINMTPHGGVAPLSLGALATHTSGLPTNYDGDETVGDARDRFTQQNFAREALTNPERPRQKQSFSYSNVNYAVLGQVITALTSAPSSDACAARIMEPAGVTDAVVGGRMWATGAFGGWSASAESYAKFAMYWLSPASPWITNPLDFAYETRSGAGLGVFHTINKDRYIVSHNGRWRHQDPARQHGAFFAVSDTGATFVANWQGNVDTSVYTELRDAVAPYLR